MLLAVWLLLVGLMLGGLGYVLYAFVRWALFIQVVVLEDAGRPRRCAAAPPSCGASGGGLSAVSLLALGQTALAERRFELVREPGRRAGGHDGRRAIGGVTFTTVSVLYFPLAANALTLYYLALRARVPVGSV